jgi:hypothetical protein
METVRATELTLPVKAVDLIDNHAGGILNYLMPRITSAAAENMNSVIQSLKHAAHWLPKFNSFRILGERILPRKGMVSPSGESHAGCRARDNNLIFYSGRGVAWIITAGALPPR